MPCITVRFLLFMIPLGLLGHEVSPDRPIPPFLQIGLFLLGSVSVLCVCVICIHTIYTLLGSVSVRCALCMCTYFICIHTI